MLDRQENKLSMYRSVDGYLNDNSTIWTGFTAFEDAKDELSTNIGAIQTAAQQQDAIITGIATDKQTLKATLIILASAIAGKVFGYASVINNNELKEAVKYSQTDLEGTRDELLGQRCQNIHNHANAHLAGLADYDVTALMLANLQSAITAYVLKSPEPRIAKAAKKAVTQQLVQLFKDTDKLLKQRLDKFMLSYKASHPQFFSGYKAARIIIDLGSTHSKIAVTVKNQSGTLLSGANVGLFQNTFPVYAKTTGSTGKASLTKVKPGTYSLRVEKNGFVTHFENGIVFTAGKKVTRTVTLVAGAATPGGTVNVEGTVLANSILHVDLSAVNPTVSTTILVEISDADARIYASVNAGDPPGTTFWDVPAPTTVLKSLVEFAALIGVDGDKHQVNIQNLSGVNGHFKFTFNNVNEIP